MQLAADVDLTQGRCKEYKVKCLDRCLAARMINRIKNKNRRIKLLKEEKFPTKDKVVEVCPARESTHQSNSEKWDQQQQRDVQAVKSYLNK